MNLINGFLTFLRQRLAWLGPTAPDPKGGAATEEEEAGDADADAGESPGEGEQQPTGAASEEDAEGGADPDHAEGDGEGGASADDNGESHGEDPDREAQEPDAGIGMAATTVRSAVEAKLAALKAQGLGRDDMPGFKFKPSITREVLDEYQRLVDADKPADAMVLLMGAGIEQAFEAYHKNIIHPLSTRTAQQERTSRLWSREQVWNQQHPEEAKNPALKKAMIEEYNDIAKKHGVLAADEVTLEELMVMAMPRVERGARPKGKGQQQEDEPAADKAKRLAARAPGAIARPRTAGKSKDGKGGKETASNPYRDYLRSSSRDPFK